MKKEYEEPEFELLAFSFESVLKDGEMTGSEGEGGGAGAGW